MTPEPRTSERRAIRRRHRRIGATPVIESLRAEVEIDGRVSMEGRGLLLFCGSGATVTVHQSGLVALEPNGDFRIDDVLAPVAPTTAATPAAPCTSPALLIVSGGGNWFAAGILK